MSGLLNAAGQFNEAAAGGGGSSMSGVISSITCGEGSDCYKSKHNDYLKKIFDEKKVNLSDAPLELSRAEKNYYKYNGGQNGGNQIYNKLIIDRFARSAEQFKQNSIDKQQEFMANLAQTLKQYQAEVIFQIQMEKLLKFRQEENYNLTKNINYYEKIVQTSERKVVYENKNMDSLYIYRRMMLFIYYSCIIWFILFANFIPDKLYLKYTVWILIVLASIMPLMLNLLIKWIFFIFDVISYWLEDLPHKDVYFSSPSMGPPPDAV
jgi:hypothetical protein